MKPADQSHGYVKAMFYGAPGTTKTRTAGTAIFVPDMSPVLMLEQAGNPLSVRDYGPQLSIVTMEKMSDYNDPYDWLLGGQPEDHPFANFLKSNKLWNDEPFKTVVVDGVSEAQRFAFKAVKPGMDAKPGSVPPSSEIRDFGGVLAMMTNWAYKFITLPELHVILTCLEYEKQDKSGNIYRRPLLWGQAEGMITSYVYMVMRLTSSEFMDVRTKSVVATEIESVNQSRIVGFLKQSISFYAKEQYGMCNDDGSEMTHMYDPTMEKIWRAING